MPAASRHKQQKVFLTLDTQKKDEDRLCTLTSFPSVGVEDACDYCGVASPLLSSLDVIIIVILHYYFIAKPQCH